MAEDDSRPVAAVEGAARALLPFYFIYLSFHSTPEPIPNYKTRRREQDQKDARRELVAVFESALGEWVLE